MTEVLDQIADPTTRTLETVHREVEQVKAELSSEMQHKEAIAIERHNSVDKQFALMEAHRLELKADAEAHRLELKEDQQKALDAALAAQKDAVKEQTAATNLANAKSEGSMNKALEQQAGTFTAAIKSLTDTLTDVKERVNGMDNFRRGVVDEHSEKRNDNNFMVQVFGVFGGFFVSGLLIAIGLYAALHK